MASGAVRLGVRRWASLLALAVGLSAAGCHNTAQGIKADTKRALDKTGDKLKKAGDKIDEKVDKKKDDH